MTNFFSFKFFSSISVYLLNIFSFKFFSSPCITHASDSSTNCKISGPVQLHLQHVLWQAAADLLKIKASKFYLQSNNISKLKGVKLTLHQPIKV
jgi:hypothetical protein